MKHRGGSAVPHHVRVNHEDHVSLPWRNDAVIVGQEGLGDSNSWDSDHGYVDLCKSGVLRVGAREDDAVGKAYGE